jgi:hypothetical protein
MNLVFFEGALVERLADDGSLPARSQPLAGLFQATAPLLVGLGCDHENEVGRLDLLLHPQPPAFFRSGDVLVEVAIETIRPQPVRERENALAVRGIPRLVGVADEHPRGARHSRVLRNGA